MNFQAWKSPGKRKRNGNSPENPGNFFKMQYSHGKSCFWHDIYPPKAFLPQISILENLNVDVEKLWKGPGKMRMKKCGNPVSTGSDDLYFLIGHKIIVLIKYLLCSLSKLYRVFSNNSSTLT